MKTPSRGVGVPGVPGKGTFTTRTSHIKAKSRGLTVANPPPPPKPDRPGRAA